MVDIKSKWRETTRVKIIWDIKSVSSQGISLDTGMVYRITRNWGLFTAQRFHLDDAGDAGAGWIVIAKERSADSAKAACKRYDAKAKEAEKRD